MKQSRSFNRIKPIKPIHKALCMTWYAWIFMTLVGYPVAVSLTTDASLWAGVGVQSLALLPAVIFAPTIHQGKSPYALMWVSMIMLIYLGASGVLTLLRIYEQSPKAVAAAELIEFLLLLTINSQLLILLKRLPAMHTKHTHPK